MASTPAPTYSFSRLYSLSNASGGSGSDQVSPLGRSGGTPGTFTLSDLPANSGSDNLGVLGDTPNDNMQVVQNIGSDTTTFSNREYVGKLAEDGGVVARVFSTRLNDYVYLLYTDNTYDPATPVSYTSSPFSLCFSAGTRILTTRGPVAVEDLRMGDVAVTAAGRERSITWTGHRHLCAASPLPLDQAPVRIRAGAFGAGLPTRDLRLSPGHPVLVGADGDGEGGVLVPVMCLINGTTIAREPVAQVTYWHIELDAHDILLAEGLAAESYIDLGSRPWFGGAEGALFDPDFVAPGMMGRCRPVAIDGPLVEAERQRIDAVFASALQAQCAWSEVNAFA